MRPATPIRPCPARAHAHAHAFGPRCAVGLLLAALTLGAFRLPSLANEESASGTNAATSATVTNAPEAKTADSSTPTHSAPDAAAPGNDTPGNSTNEAPASARLDFPAFKLIADRNIFNTTRSARRPGGNRPREARRTPKVESISLLGTLAYEKGRFAFFEGSSTDYRKVLRQGDSIAGHTIESISQSAIRLTQGDRVLNLRVSQHLRREDDGDWQLSDTAAAPASTPSTTSTTSTSSTSSSDGATPSADTTSPAAASGGGEVSDILKRLMQQREKELK